MVKVLGIGIGLFLMSILWPTVLLFYTISRRAKPPVNTFGLISVILMSVITIILILIPRRSETFDERLGIDSREPDLMSLFRPLIIIINIIALFIGLAIIYCKYVCKQIIRPKLSELNIKTINPFIK